MSQNGNEKPFAKVHVRFYCDKICAKVPPHLSKVAASISGCKYIARWSCWVLNPEPYLARNLLNTFKGELGSIDKETISLAQSYDASQKQKEAENLPDIPNMKSPAWNHQRQAFHFAKDISGTMLAMDMGTGKTFTSIGLIQHRKHDQIMIIAPKSVIAVWPLEFSRYATEKFIICAPRKGTIADKTKFAKAKMEDASKLMRPFVLILNYEAFWRPPINKWIQSVMWDQIVYDEIHRIKAPKGKSSTFAFSLVKNSKFRMGLTGTLLPHSPLDAFGQFKAIDPSVFGTSYFRFRNRYATMGGFGGKQVVAYENQLEMNEKIESISYQVEASDVQDLPETIHSYRLCTLNPKTRKLYDELDDDMYAEIEAGEINIANAMVKVLRLQQLTSGYLKTDDGEIIQYGEEKYELFKEVLGEIPQKKPVVIFCRFTSDIQNVQKACESMGRTCAELSGHKNNLAEWQAGKFNCIAVQVKSGGVGIDLTRSSYCVYYSIGHSLGDYRQSLKRTHRPGQKHTVKYYHLLAEGTVDPTVYAALRSRKKVVDYILKGVRIEAENL